MNPSAFAGVQAVLLDIDGVLVTSWRALPGAAGSLRWLREEGIPFRLLTNTTERSRASLVRLLGETGIEVTEDELLTAPVATAAYLERHHRGARVFLMGTGEAAMDLVGVDLVDGDVADVVVVGGPGPEFAYERVNRAFRLVMDGAALVAMQRNRYWRTDEGLMLDAGGYVTALEVAADVRAITVGKPSPAMFEAALADMGVDAAQAVMVGDDVESDVGGAQGAGLRGVLVRTGKFRAGADTGRRPGPDAVIDSVADIPRLIGAS